ncbi:solute carrier family 2, facilitated glucose transporter member 11b isoform X2 [Ictalurus punctatus]|uniref:Solute carrier family 2, facilitated glucose transporter member 11b isoform X2 n=1 Tax=Ictalurus punctatus TaxID=7998 RepID=A0A2D0PNI5_ICTPU|nr:solute carrier family 2, facilitated glucose transporter member 11b isoform X2 [Ictalurus punctatus]
MTEKDFKEHQPLLRKQQEIKVPSKTLLMAVWAAGIGGTFQYGYNVSIINAPNKEVQRFINQTWIKRYDTNISAELLTLLWSSIVSIFTIGGLVGASIGASLAVHFGRKGTLLINNSFALLAAVLMGLSSLTAAFELLIAGRFISGINAGVGACVQPLYLGEIAPRALRGAMAMGTSIFITGGILTGQVIGLTELLGGEQYWPLLLISPCVPAVLQLIFLPQFPESPRFLLIDRADEVACTTALQQLHGGEHFQVEMEDMQRERISAEGIKPLKPWQLFTECRNRWPLFIVILISTAQQLNGINAIYFYAEYVFREAGIPAENIPYVTLGTGACECITALTCSLLIERLGRRALIIGGYSLMSLWCVCFTLALSFQKVSSWVPYLSMLCIFAFILSFGLGPGGVTNILITELFTQTTRPAAYMIAGSVNWLSFFFISMVFPFIVNGLQQFCFLIFLVICCLVATFIFFFVPETKNKTFLEIQSELSGKETTVSQVSNGLDVSQVSTSL